MGHDRRSVLASIAIVFAVGAVVVAALLADGREASESETNDGGAWLLNRDRGVIGQVNRVAAEVTLVAGPFGGAFEVDQSTGVVVVQSPSEGRVTLIDTARSQPLTSIQVNRSVDATAAPGAVVLHDDTAGSIWRLTVDEFGTIEALAETAPSLQTAGAVDVAVSQSGAVSVVESAASTIRWLATDGTTSSIEAAGMDSSPVASVTVVGDRTVIAHADGKLRVATGGGVETFDPGVTLAVLQQPMMDGLVVAGVTADGAVVEIDLLTGDANELRQLDGTNPLAPIVHNGCVHVVTIEPAPAYHFCGVSQPLDGAGSELRLRLVNEWVWVNDATRGDVWFVSPESDELRQVSDWSSALPEDEASNNEADVDGVEDLVESPDADEVSEEVDPLDDDEDNEPPQAVDDEAETRSGRTIVVDVLANDTDADNDPLAVESLSGVDADGFTPEGARVTITADGTAVQVVPNVDQVGAVTFGYQVHDGRQGRDQASVTVTVVALDPATNRPPEPQPDNGTVRAGRSVSMNVLTNDRDPDGDVLVLTAVDDGGGIVAFAPDGEITFTPDVTAEEGTVVLEYVVADDYGAEASSEIRIRVRPAGSNQAPQGRNDVGRTAVGRSVLIDVLNNDSDPDGDPLSALNLVSVEPEGVFAELTPDGLFLFTPEASGTYRFTYLVSDGPESDQAQVRVDAEAAPQNRPPVPVVDEAAIAIGETRLIRVLDNDADPDGDVVGIVDWNPTPGLEIAEVAGVGFRVTATPTALPRSAFLYFVSDGQAEPVASSVIVSTLRRDPVDYAPVAVSDTVDVRPGQTVDIAVLGNDYDPEGGGLRVAEPLAEFAEGTLRLDPSGQVLSLTVEPVQQFGFSFGYDVVDENGNRNSAVVQVRVVPPSQANRAPIAAPDVARTAAGSSVIIQALANDSDPDGDPFTIESIARQPADGTVEILADGTLQYTPRRGFAGTDRFIYTLVDGYSPPIGTTDSQGRSLGEVAVGVMPEPPVNRPPTAVDDDNLPPIAVGGSATRIDVLANDSDPDNDPITVTEVSQPAVGIVEIGANDRAVEYTPPESGSPREVSFSYSIADGAGGADSATVTLRLDAAPEPLPPVAVDDTVGPVGVGTPVTFDPRSNDFDPDGDRNELSVVASSAFVSNGDGTITVTAPAATGDIAYQVIDAQDLVSEPGFITVLVTENEPPEVPIRQLSTNFGETIEISLHQGVTDPDGDDLLYALGGNRTGGSVSVVGSPAANFLTVRFTPDTDFEGQASFDFTVDDQQGHNVASTIVIDVLPPENRPPEATDLVIELEAGVTSPVDLALLVFDPDVDNGDDTLTFTVGNVSGAVDVTGPSPAGVATVSSAVDAGGAAGTFTYTVTDSQGQTASGIVSVTLTTAQFPAPTVTPDSAQTLQGQVVAVDLLENDADNSPAELRGAGLQIVSVGVTPDGSTSRQGGTVEFRPAPSFFGTTTFTYTVQDGRRSAEFESTGTVTIDVIGRPAAPQPPTVGAPGDGYLIVNWQAPAGNGAAIDGYVLEYEAGDGGSGSLTLNTPATNYRWVGLSNGTPHRFRVRAVNQAGQGDFSDYSLPATPDVRPETPVAPARPQFGDGRLIVTWTAPVSNGSAIVDYEVEIGGGAAGTRRVGGTSTTLVWEPLTNGTDYTFRVRARNSATSDGDGWSDWSGFSETDHPLTNPDAPAQPSADRGDRQVAVTWSAPADGGDTISQYELRRVGAGSTIAITPQGATNTYTWSDLSNGQPVSFEVRAINRDPLPGPWSPASPVVTPCSVPDAPSGLTAQRGDRLVSLSWTAPFNQGCAISGYVVTATPGGAVQTTGPGVTSMDFTGLMNGTPYTFVVAALNDVVTVDGQAPNQSAGASATPAGPPTPAPTLTSCANTGVRQVRCTWNAAGDNGDPISRYEVSVNSGSWTSAGNTLQYDYNAGSDGASYSFRVRAVNGVGPSSQSNQLTVTTWAVPGTPSVSATSGDSQVTATWNTPSNGGTGLTSSQARLTSGGCTTGTVRTNPGSPETFSASNGTTYRVCVRYQNAVGWGPWGQSNAVTPQAPPPQITLVRGASANGQPLCVGDPGCYWYNVSLSGFSAGQTVRVYCNDSVDAQFWTQDITVNAAGNGGDATLCYSTDGPAHWVTSNVGITSNTVNW